MPTSLKFVGGVRAADCCIEECACGMWLEQLEFRECEPGLQCGQWWHVICSERPNACSTRSERMWHV